MFPCPASRCDRRDSPFQVALLLLVSLDAEGGDAVLEAWIPESQRVPSSIS